MDTSYRVTEKNFNHNIANPPPSSNSSARACHSILGAYDPSKHKVGVKDGKPVLVPVVSSSPVQSKRRGTGLQSRSIVLFRGTTQEGARYSLSKLRKPGLFLLSVVRGGVMKKYKLSAFKGRSRQLVGSDFIGVRGFQVKKLLASLVTARFDEACKRNDRVKLEVEGGGRTSASVKDVSVQVASQSGQRNPQAENHLRSAVLRNRGAGHGASISRRGANPYPAGQGHGASGAGQSSVSSVQDAGNNPDELESSDEEILEIGLPNGAKIISSSKGRVTTVPADQRRGVASSRPQRRAPPPPPILDRSQLLARMKQEMTRQHFIMGRSYVDWVTVLGLEHLKLPGAAEKKSRPSNKVLRLFDRATGGRKRRERKYAGALASQIDQSNALARKATALSSNRELLNQIQSALAIFKAVAGFEFGSNEQETFLKRGAQVVNQVKVLYENLFKTYVNICRRMLIFAKIKSLSPLCQKILYAAERLPREIVECKEYGFSIDLPDPLRVKNSGSSPYEALNRKLAGIQARVSIGASLRGPGSCYTLLKMEGIPSSEKYRPQLREYRPRLEPASYGYNATCMRLYKRAIEIRLLQEMIELRAQFPA